MLKKYAFPVMLILVLVLSACSSLQLPWSGTSNAQASQAVEDKLAAGILKLSGTNLSVTTTQAQEMLSLWKGVKSLGASSATSTEEMSALYEQIQGVLTADQVQAIQKMNMTSTDLDALMQKYSVQTSQAATSVASASQSTQSGSSQAAGPDTGGMPGGAPPSGDPNMTAGAAMTGQTDGQSSSVSVQLNSVSQTSTNVLFAESVILMLEQIVNA